LRGERRLVSVVLGAASDAARRRGEARSSSYGFQAFDTVALYQSGKTVTTAAGVEGSAPESRRASSPIARDAAEGPGGELALSLVAQER